MEALVSKIEATKEMAGGRYWKENNYYEIQVSVSDYALKVILNALVAEEVQIYNHVWKEWMSRKELFFLNCIGSELEIVNIWKGHALYIPDAWALRPSLPKGRSL